jgi:ubiquinone/menaquinone biosynthesis C-methylase UbiE
MLATPRLVASRRVGDRGRLGPGELNHEQGWRSGLSPFPRSRGCGGRWRGFSEDDLGGAGPSLWRIGGPSRAGRGIAKLLKETRPRQDAFRRTLDHIGLLLDGQGEGCKWARVPLRLRSRACQDLKAMGFYQNQVVPLLTSLSMRNENLAAYRQRVVPEATGRVLEIGIGSGLNLPLYSPKIVQQVIGLEPSPKLLEMARRVERHGLSVDFLEGSAEEIPLENASFDTVVTTWTLCTIPDPDSALRQIRRVLKPGGRLLFVEHGRAPDPKVVWWQDRLTPIWKRIGGGCHLNRPISSLIEGAGFRLERLKTSYMPGPKPMTFMYEGSAQ